MAEQTTSHPDERGWHGRNDITRPELETSRGAERAHCADCGQPIHGVDLGEIGYEWAHDAIADTWACKGPGMVQPEPTAAELAQAEHDAAGPKHAAWCAGPGAHYADPEPILGGERPSRCGLCHRDAHRAGWQGHYYQTPGQ